MKPEPQDALVEQRKPWEILRDICTPAEFYHNERGWQNKLDALLAALSTTDAARIASLEAELARRDRNENRNCINWGPCSEHDGRMPEEPPVLTGPVNPDQSDYEVAEAVYELLVEDFPTARVAEIAARHRRLGQQQGARATLRSTPGNG